ncbi:Beta carbonic anhydrase 1 [Schistosoma japonicum]|nr:Beta carbonic anhydrase 1 [Schistosoma japonicum]KAH8855124.1 Beta carbonic anhydrase 1 [Schistosoma japonicum]
MNQILSRILKLAHFNKPLYLNQLKGFNEKPNILAAVVTCVDSRVIPSTFLCSNVGELFIKRNPGNFVCCENTSLNHSNENYVTPGFLELTLIRCKITDIIICGHSDCRAMNLLNNLGKCMHEQQYPYLSHHYHQSNSIDKEVNKLKSSPLEKWIWENGCKTLQNFHLKSNILSFTSSLHSNCPKLELDLNLVKHLTEIDLLSQANVLQQMINVYSYEMLTKQLQQNFIRVHGMWFELHSGDTLVYNRQNKSFIPINEATISSLIDEV